MLVVPCLVTLDSVTTSSVVIQCLQTVSKNRHA